LSMTSNLNNAWFISIFGFIAAVAISIYSIVGRKPPLLHTCLRFQHTCCRQYVSTR
jgi:hypothetical protein